MTLDYSPLARALGQLETSLDFAASPLARSNPALADQFRAAAIQGFEFTYELSHKMLRRYLESVSATPATVATLPFPDLIRAGWAQGLLLHEWAAWKEYREARAITSHTYDVDKAEKVFARIPHFVEDARYLLAALQNAASTGTQ